MWDHKYGMRQQRWMVWCVRHTKTMSKLYYMTKKTWSLRIVIPLGSFHSMSNGKLLNSSYGLMPKKNWQAVGISYDHR